jgi:hypothetical protein
VLLSQAREHIPPLYILVCCHQLHAVVVDISNLLVPHTRHYRHLCCGSPRLCCMGGKNGCTMVLTSCLQT